MCIDFTVKYKMKYYIFLVYFTASDGEDLAKMKKVKILRNKKREGTEFSLII